MTSEEVVYEGSLHVSVYNPSFSISLGRLKKGDLIKLDILRAADWSRMVKVRILKHARIRLPLPPKAGVGRPGIDDRFVVNGIYALVIRYY
ncbi:hypothetical protein [Candidatus Methanodesulfokora washburnensis]|jgi:hypothetical protein|uniref:Uncharacterized protein n=1 Tax=Candidatus Methanodesulfokora washburnensis TaxID=2478471 RepID=A0A3R9PG23_9CREN|nr:hypothetical protein [Candidatus Methanodesulfokores washburnensis]RSN73472.1 hypothetical protein D6D85_10300 [Candidatus Methanodesulfokores washburnensis]